MMLIYLLSIGGASRWGMPPNTTYITFLWLSFHPPKIVIPLPTWCSPQMSRAFAMPFLWMTFLLLGPGVSKKRCRGLTNGTPCEDSVIGGWHMEEMHWLFMGAPVCEKGNSLGSKMLPRVSDKVFCRNQSTLVLQNIKLIWATADQIPIPVNSQ
jgi:hypothetical protein